MSSVAVSIVFGVVEVLVLLAFLRVVILGGMPKGMAELKERLDALEQRVATLEAGARARDGRPLR